MIVNLLTMVVVEVAEGTGSSVRVLKMTLRPGNPFWTSPVGPGGERTDQQGETRTYGLLAGGGGQANEVLLSGLPLKRV